MNLICPAKINQTRLLIEETPKIPFRERVENPETVAVTSVLIRIVHRKNPLTGSLPTIIRGITFCTVDK